MFRQVSSYMTANVVSAVFGFISVVLFTRVLSPNEYGIYIIGSGIAAMISTVLFGWIKVSIVRIASEEGASDIRMTVLFSFLALILLIPVLASIAIKFFPTTFDYPMSAIALAYSIGFFEFYLELFRSNQKTTAYMWSTIIRAALALASSCVLVIVFDLGGDGLILSVALSYVLTSALYSAYIWRHPLQPFDGTILKEMLRFGLPMTVSGAVFMLHAMLDRLVIGAYLGEHAAGIYGASADLVRQVILFPGVAVGSAIIPIAIRLMTQGNKEAATRHMLHSMELLLGVLMPAVVGMALVAGKLSGLVLGGEFHEAAANLIPIIAFAWLFRSISYQFIHVSFQLHKKPLLMIAQGVVTLASNIVAMSILIPRYQLLGAAYSLLLSEVIGTLVGYALSRKAYRLPFDLVSTAKVCLATAIMALPTYLVDRSFPGSGILDLALPVATGAIVYAFASFALNVADIRTGAMARLAARA